MITFWQTLCSQAALKTASFVHSFVPLFIKYLKNFVSGPLSPLTLQRRHAKTVRYGASGCAIEYIRHKDFLCPSDFSSSSVMLRVF